MLTAEDKIKIEGRCRELEMDLSNLKKVRAEAYSTALDSIKSTGMISIKQAQNLNDIQSFLMINENEIFGPKEELTRLCLITEIKNGNLPKVEVPNIILQKNELAYLKEPSKIMEQRVVGTRYEGGSSGVSVRIAKGVS